MNPKISQAITGGIVATIAMTLFMMIAPMMGMPKNEPTCNAFNDDRFSNSCWMDNALYDRNYFRFNLRIAICKSPKENKQQNL